MQWMTGAKLCVSGRCEPRHSRERYKRIEMLQQQQQLCARLKPRETHCKNTKTSYITKNTKNLTGANMIPKVLSPIPASSPATCVLHRRPKARYHSRVPRNSTLRFSAQHLLAVAREKEPMKPPLRWCARTWARKVT